ncbi:MAG TPA: flagellin [Solirubrobacteraceae bacterium]|nr:flagellin [Solirubrobacteraceae bacterium]
MSLTINTNVEAMNAQRNLSMTENSLSTSMQRLSSGLRINSAADDVAGYAISQKLQGQINGLGQAQQNSQDAVTLSQTAQGSLNEVQQMLQRIRELAVQYKNGTNSTADQTAIASEVSQLTSEIERVGQTTQFNGVNLLSSTSTISFQVGANDGQVIAVSTISLGSSVGTISLGSATAISGIDAAIDAVSAAAGEFGAVQNRLQYTLDNLATYHQNLSAAQSSIVDVDMAAEMTNFTKHQVLQQAGTSVLAQANQLPQAVLRLLQ